MYLGPLLPASIQANCQGHPHGMAEQISWLSALAQTHPLSLKASGERIKCVCVCVYVCPSPCDYLSASQTHQFYLKQGRRIEELTGAKTFCLVKIPSRIFPPRSYFQLLPFLCVCVSERNRVQVACYPSMLPSLLPNILSSLDTQEIRKIVTPRTSLYPTRFLNFSLEIIKNSNEQKGSM